MYPVYFRWMPATRKPGKPKLQMVQVRLEESLVKWLDEFCWVHRVEDRTKLIRQLLTWALDHHDKPKRSS